MIGDSERVIFDEILKGLHRKTNAMTLVYAYRLHGFFAGILVIALLYLWYATSSFLPPLSESEAVTHHDSAHDAATGLANLLQRHVSARELLQTCMRHWQAGQRRNTISDENLTRMAKLAADPLPRAGRDEALVERYKEMCTLTERTKRH
jgi:hypothetical protein